MESLPSKPVVMAHQGGAGLWPSNTLYAFERAAAMQVDALEMDIHSTADGVIVVRHDATVDSTTDGSGAIHGYTLAELKKLDAGYTWTPDGGRSFPYRGAGITIPTLEEVMQTFPGMRLNIDIKQAVPSIVEPFVGLLEKYDLVRRVIVGSFHDAVLGQFRRLCPQAATAAGVSETRNFFFACRLGLARLARLQAAAFQVPEWSGRLHVVTPAFVRAAHARGLQVHVWTVDAEPDIRRLLDWGVDGIITDYPDRGLAVRRAFSEVR
jgi:glycerophosphoryl diester phosphodiesterase